MSPDFLATPPSFVLCLDDENGNYHPPQEQGGGVPCHLMLTDALIELAQLQRLGTPHHLVSAGLVDRSFFLDSDGLGYIACVHLGWPARDGVLCTRPSGGLAAYYRRVHVSAAAGPPPSTFQIDAALDEVNRIRELAGMFAWQETAALTEDWTIKQMERIAARALNMVQVQRGDVSQVNQIALFDPEFEQWHYVPWDKVDAFL